MEKLLPFSAAIGACILFCAFWAIRTYNRIHDAIMACDEASANLEAALTRRYDLIPNLVEAVRAHCGHERTTFAEVVAARARCNAAVAQPDRASAEAELSRSLLRVLAVAERHPTLTTSKSFESLHSRLDACEVMIQGARERYNATVRVQYGMLGGFPQSLLAWMFQVPLRPFWRCEQAGSRMAPSVRL